MYLTLDASSCVSVNAELDCITNLDVATQVFAVAVKNGYDTGVKVERIESKYSFTLKCESIKKMDNFALFTMTLLCKFLLNSERLHG